MEVSNDQLKSYTYKDKYLYLNEGEIISIH